MKKIYVLLFLLLPLAAGAQQRLVLLEHFTQASCGPCAANAPNLNAAIAEVGDKMIRIKYHTSWPGVDPMYNHNTAESAARVNYYNVTGVPNSVIDGNVHNGIPAGFSGGWTPQLVENRSTVSSQFKVDVKHRIVDNAGTTQDTIYVTVKLTAETDITSAYTLLSAVVEKDVRFATPPGTNGEKEFDFVFKKFANGSAGTATPASMTAGDSVVYDFKWKMANIYDMTQLATIAFVQNNTNKEVLNAGYSSPNLELNMNSINGTTHLAPSGDTTWYDVNFNPSNTEAGEDYRIVLKRTGTFPASWQSFLKINGVTSQDTLFATIPSHGNQLLQVGVITSDSLNLKANLTIWAGSTTTFPTFGTTVNITAIGPANTLYVQKQSVTKLNNAMSAAQIKSVVLTADEFTQLKSESLESSTVRDIYLNTGTLSVNTLTEDDAAKLKTFLDRGGNLFIAGQDIGWEMDQVRSDVVTGFYADYMGATYMDDYAGAGAVSRSLQIPATDSIFGGIANGTLTAGTNANGWSPDLIDINANSDYSVAALYHGAIANGIVAAVRNNGPNWKVVYVPIRFDQMNTPAFLAAYMTHVKAWFDNMVLPLGNKTIVTEFAWGSAFPNPANSNLNIPVNAKAKASMLSVTDGIGRVVTTRSIAAG
ncbi:MAG: hypothetical protein V4543_06865, partial [Bacteroidota bacterium]